MLWTVAGLGAGEGRLASEAHNAGLGRLLLLLLSRGGIAANLHLRVALVLFLVLQGRVLPVGCMRSSFERSLEAGGSLGAAA